MASIDHLLRVRCAVMTGSPLQDCKQLERLYVRPEFDGPFTFKVLGPTSLTSLRHLSICADLGDIPWSNLTIPALESLTMDHDYPSRHQSDALHQFLERCPSLRLLQLGLTALESNPAGSEVEPLFNQFSSTTIHTLQLELSWLCQNIYPLLSLLTVHQLKKQFPGLCHIHVCIADIIDPDTHIGFGDAIAQATFALGNDIEQCHAVGGMPSSLQMVHLHTGSSHKHLISQVSRTSSRLRVTSTPLRFDWDGENYFPFDQIIE
ncbi:hypothetical protein DL96DRAFT_377021 [Flagelloscypha sp. PMI_526]|nr:hypothetical protein DL96DRAFT_377021 [Flagelloscypha sp. PMI_526]